MEHSSSVYSDILLIGSDLKELEIAKDLEKIIPADKNYRKSLAEITTKKIIDVEKALGLELPSAVKNMENVMECPGYIWEELYYRLSELKKVL